MNGIGKQYYEPVNLSIGVALLSETCLKPHERFFIPHYRLHLTDSYPGIKGGSAVVVRKGVPHNLETWKMIEYA
jgi:hypothetical protein